MFKSRRDTTNIGQGTSVSTPSSHGKSSHARRSWRRLSTGKKVVIIVLPLVVLAILCYAISLLFTNEDQELTPSKDSPAEKKINVAELVAKPPTESMPVDEKLAYYDKLTLGYAQEGKYDKAVESFTIREGISTKGRKFNDYLNLAQYQFGAGHKEAAPAALDKAEAELKADPNMTEQDKTELLKFITKLRQGYTQ